MSIIKHGLATLAGTIILSALAPSAAYADDLHISGSHTVMARFITPNKDKLEKATGLTLVLAPMPSEKGVEAVLSKTADVAMISIQLSNITPKI